MFSKRWISFFMAWALVAPALAQTPPAAFEGDQPNVFGEAGRAVVGRVFGMKDQGGDIQYYNVNLSRHSRFNAGFRSALIPGWGQGFNEQKIKGTALFITTMGALAGSVFFYDKSNDSFDDHLASGQRNNSDFDDHETERSLSLALGIVAGVLWGYSVIDAYRDAYGPLWSSQAPVDLVVGPDEAKITVGQRF